MEDANLFHTIGKFESKIESLERSVERLEGIVVKLAHSMETNKGSWRILMALGAASAFFGVMAHKPIELLMELFK